MTKKIKWILALVAIVVVAGLIGFLVYRHNIEENTIVVYSDGDYIDQTLIDAFTQETNIRVNYIVGNRTPTAKDKADYLERRGFTSGNATVYSSADAISLENQMGSYQDMSLREILLSSRQKNQAEEDMATNGDAAAYQAQKVETSGDAETTYPEPVYDVMLTDSDTIDQLIDCQLVQELDKSAIPNAKNIDDTWTDAAHDPEGRYSVTCLWETLGLLWNNQLIDDQQSSWDGLVNEDYAGQILMPNNQRDCLAIALNALGYDVNTNDSKQIQAAYDYLEKQKPLVASYTDGDLYPLMMEGLAAIAPCYSGDALAILQQNSDLSFCLPSGGTYRIAFGYCVSADTQKADKATQFINYMCSTTNLAKNAVYSKYSIPSETAVDKLDASWRNNPLAYPPESIVNNAPLLSGLEAETRAQSAVLWTKLTQDEPTSTEKESK